MSQQDFANINARDFARVLPFRATQDVRYYLNGVYVEPMEHGAIIVATNGHTLAAMRSPDTFVKEPILVEVTPAFAAAVKRVGKSELSFVRAVSKTSTLEVFDSAIDNLGKVVFVKPGSPFIDGKFPQWRQVIPADDKILAGLPATYNSDYLQLALNAITSGPRASRYGTLLQFHHAAPTGDEKGTVAIIRDQSNFICLVMPVHSDRVEAIPGWTRQAPAVAAESKAA